MCYKNRMSETAMLRHPFLIYFLFWFYIFSIVHLYIIIYFCMLLFGNGIGIGFGFSSVQYQRRSLINAKGYEESDDH